MHDAAGMRQCVRSGVDDVQPDAAGMRQCVRSGIDGVQPEKSLAQEGCKHVIHVQQC